MKFVLIYASGSKAPEIIEVSDLDDLLTYHGIVTKRGGLPSPIIISKGDQFLASQGREFQKAIDCEWVLLIYDDYIE